MFKNVTKGNEIGLLNENSLMNAEFITTIYNKTQPVRSASDKHSCFFLLLLLLFACFVFRQICCTAYELTVRDTYIGSLSCLVCVLSLSGLSMV